MTWPAPTGAPQTEPRLPDRANNPKRTGEASYHPDVLAYARQYGITRGRTLDVLQREYDRALAARVRREDAAAEWSPALTRIVGRSGSRAVDSRVGDRASRHLDNNICGVDAAHTHFEREN